MNGEVFLLSMRHVTRKKKDKETQNWAQMETRGKKNKAIRIDKA